MDKMSAEKKDPSWHTVVMDKMSAEKKNSSRYIVTNG
jgi:hypothetical protein